MSKLLIAGTVAYDSLKTPQGERPRILGGSALHAAVAATILSRVNLLSVVGGDFEQEHLDFLSGRGIDISGVKIIPDGKTFAWSGFYEKDMNQAHSLQTELNVLTQFDPVLPKHYLDSEIVFLGNIDPDLQLKIFEQLPDRKFGAIDSMNFWIDSKKEQLLKVIAQADLLFINDAEIRQLTGIDNLIKAARSLLTGRLQYVALKKGEHGSLLIGKDKILAAPSYPIEDIVDPTGAGDAFAGGFMTYITKHDLSWTTLHEALVYGTLLASFNVQGFGCERIANVNTTMEDVKQRLLEYNEITTVK